MTKMKRRTMSLLLAVCMVMTLLPISVLAVDDPGTQPGQSGRQRIEITVGENQTFKILSEGTALDLTYKYEVAGGEQRTFDPATDELVITTNGANGASINIKSGVPTDVPIHMTLKNCTFDHDTESYESTWNMVDSAVDVVLTLEGENTFTAGSSRIAMPVPEGAVYTIKGTGSLNLSGGNALGGNAGQNGITGELVGTVIWESGTINVEKGCVDLKGLFNLTGGTLANVNAGTRVFTSLDCPHEGGGTLPAGSLTLAVGSDGRVKHTFTASDFSGDCPKNYFDGVVHTVTNLTAACSDANASAEGAAVTFSEVGSYTVTLSGKIDDKDYTKTVAVTVNEEPVYPNMTVHPLALDTEEQFTLGGEGTELINREQGSHGFSKAYGKLFSLALTEGQAVRVDLQPGDLNVELYALKSRTGVLADDYIADADNGGSHKLETVAFKAPADGTYYILAKGYSESDVGLCTLTATLVELASYHALTAEPLDLAAAAEVSLNERDAALIAGEAEVFDAGYAKLYAVSLKAGEPVTVGYYGGGDSELYALSGRSGTVADDIYGADGGGSSYLRVTLRSDADATHYLLLKTAGLKEDYGLIDREYSYKELTPEALPANGAAISYKTGAKLIGPANFSGEGPSNSAWAQLFSVSLGEGEQKSFTLWSDGETAELVVLKSLTGMPQDDVALYEQSADDTSVTLDAGTLGAGTYYLLAKPYHMEYSQSLALSETGAVLTAVSALTPQALPDGGATFTLGGAESQLLRMNNRLRFAKRYSVTLEAGTEYQFALRPQGQADVVLALYDDAAVQEIDSEDAGGTGEEETFLYTPQTAGTYSVVAQGYGLYDTGKVAVSVSAADVIPYHELSQTLLTTEGAASSLGGAGSQLIKGIGDTSFGALYSLDLNQGQSVELVLEPDFDAVLCLLKSLTGDAGQDIAAYADHNYTFGQGYNGEQILYSAPALGRYFVLVKGYSRNDMGDYRLNLSHFDATVLQPSDTAGKTVYVKEENGQTMYQIAEAEPVAGSWAQSGVPFKILTGAGKLDCDLHVLSGGMTLSLGQMDLGAGKLSAAEGVTRVFLSGQSLSLAQIALPGAYLGTDGSITVTGNSAIGELTVGSGNFANGGVLEIEGDLDIASSASFHNRGTVAIEDAGNGDTDVDGTLQNDGVFSTAGDLYIYGIAINAGQMAAYDCRVKDSGSFLNNGELTITDRFALHDDSSFENSGTLTADKITVDATGTGTLRNLATGQIKVTGQFKLFGTFHNAGKFENAGTMTLEGGKFVNTGTADNTGLVAAVDPGDAMPSIENTGTLTGGENGLGLAINDNNAMTGDSLENLKLLGRLGKVLMGGLDISNPAAEEHLNATLENQGYTWEKTGDNSYLLTLSSLSLMGHLNLPADVAVVIQVENTSEIVLLINKSGGSITIQGPGKLNIGGLGTGGDGALTIAEGAEVHSSGNIHTGTLTVEAAALLFVNGDQDKPLVEVNHADIQGTVEVKNISGHPDSEGLRIHTGASLVLGETALVKASAYPGHPAISATGEDSTAFASLTSFLPPDVRIVTIGTITTFTRDPATVTDPDPLSSVTLAKTATVSFYPNNGQTVTEVIVNRGDTVEAPSVSYTGHTLDGWYTADGQKFDFATEVTADISLFARWTKDNNPSGGGTTSYLIKATAGKGGGISPNGDVYVAQGESATFTITPKEGYTVKDVVVDGKSVGARTSYTFENVKEGHTIEATFIKGAPGTALPFSDVAAGDWFYAAVQYVFDQGLMNGTSATTFSPNDNATRAMIAVILHRFMGEPSSDGTTLAEFTDVSEIPAWALNAMRWAVHEGIFTGTDEKKLDPNGLVTREQLVTIFYRCAKIMNLNLSAGEDTNILSYKDALTISEYAVEAFQWACGAGIIDGKPGGILDPKGNATRAEIAVISQRFATLSAK